MESLIIWAGAVPFGIIVIAVIALASVRCRITGDRLKLTILGFTAKDVPLGSITSVVYVPAEQAPGWGVFHRGGVVVVEYAGPKGKGALSVSPADAEGVAEHIRQRVTELTGRKV